MYVALVSLSQDLLKVQMNPLMLQPYCPRTAVSASIVPVMPLLLLAIAPAAALSAGVESRLPLSATIASTLSLHGRCLCM